MIQNSKFKTHNLSADKGRFPTPCLSGCSMSMVCLALQHTQITVLNYIAKTFHGLENLLSEELQALGATNISPLKRAIAFEGDVELLYRANLHLRTATRILCPIHEFKALNEDQLYEASKAYTWEDWLGTDTTFAIDTTMFSPRFRHSGFLSLRLKDGIVDRFREIYGIRPSVDTENPAVRFHLHVSDSQFTISVDSTGDSLHKRGYREQTHTAPLNEVLAAGMIMLTGWDRKMTFLDPMCGSGTLLAEAGLMATNTPPCFHRKYFSFMGWRDFDADLWKKIMDEARENITPPTAKILGSDISQRAIDIAIETLNGAGMDHIELQQMPFEEVMPPSETGIIVMNPPYGERLHEEDIIGLYSSVGDHLKRSYAGWTAWMISSNMPALKRVGLRPSKKLVLFNGALECRFQEFSMYSGSKKASKQNPISEQ